MAFPTLLCSTHVTFTEEILAGEKGCVLNWSSGSVDDRHSREQVGLYTLGVSVSVYGQQLQAVQLASAMAKRIYNIYKLGGLNFFPYF